MIRYLKVLKSLDPLCRGVRSVEVARALSISRSSVHTMMERLSESGLVEKVHYGIVYLTEEGIQLAEKQ